MLNAPAVNTSLCPLRLGGRCARCMAVCPSNAMDLRDGPAIQIESCKNCGACASVCPTGALVHDAPASLLRTLAERDVAPHALRCPKAGRCAHDELPVSGCLSSLGLETLLALWRRQKGTVTFFTGNCAACRSGDGGKNFETVLKQARAILAHSADAPANPFVVRTWSKKDSPSRRESDVSLSRRGFLGFLAHSVTPSTDNGSSTKPGKTDRRVQLAKLLKALNAKGATPEGVAFGMIRADGHCTACGACANVCTTGALRLTKEGSRRTLEFIPALCVDCGACVNVCLPRFLHPSPTNLESFTLSPQTLFQGEIGTCKRCRAQTSALDENGYCAICSHKLRAMDN